jgi:hypothetical protein
MRENFPQEKLYAIKRTSEDPVATYLQSAMKVRFGPKKGF